MKRYFEQTSQLSGFTTARGLIVVIACDVDPIDKFRQKKLDQKEDIWYDTIKNIPILEEKLKSSLNLNGNSPKITWFLRSDEQMKTFFDDYAYPVKTFFTLWKSLRDQGDEIGWHPHFWRWSEVNYRWYPELKDQAWIENCLDKGYHRVTDFFEVSSVRVGFNFNSDLVMKKLSDFGIIADLSALPRKKIISPDRNVKPPWEYDWKATSERFYFPSKNDYRREAKENEESLEILEMPISLSPIPIYLSLSKFLYNMCLSLRRGFVRSMQFERNDYMMISKSPQFFTQGVKNKIKKSKIGNCATHLICWFHSEDLLETKGLFSATNLEKNLKSLFEHSKKYDVPLRFLTATEVAKEHLAEERKGLKKCFP